MKDLSSKDKVKEIEANQTSGIFRPVEPQTIENKGIYQANSLVESELSKSEGLYTPRAERDHQPYNERSSEQKNDEKDRDHELDHKDGK